MFRFLSKNFVDVIEWLEDAGQLAWRVPFKDQEIQNGAQLTVREGQLAAFFNEGQIADVMGPGLHSLNTENLPLLTSLLNWDKGFKSPFKSDVVFFSRKEQVGLKWGTTQPLTIRDAEFGALRIRAFGSYSFQIADVGIVCSRLLGTLPGLQVSDLEPQLRSAIVTALASGLGSSGIPFLDLAANQQKLSEIFKASVEASFAQWGLTVASFFVESLSLPEEMQAHLDKGSGMRLVGDLDRYSRFQTADAMGIAAAQSGGVAAIGAGAAAAAAIGGAMAGSGAAQVTPATAAADDPFALIEKLHRLVAAGALTQAEFDAKKAEILARIG